MYDPQADDMSFEGIFDKIKKGAKAVGQAAFVAPSAAIGGAIGGKTGRKIGEKLGQAVAFTTLAGAAPTVAAHVGAHKLLTRKGRKSSAGRRGPPSMATLKAAHMATHKTHHAIQPKASTDSALAAKVAAMLVAKLGPELSKANKYLALADLQREATYEHSKLMNDATFRRKVLTGIAKAAALGDASCERTIRVIMG